MRYKITALTLFLGLHILAAGPEYREFTAADGRSITAKLVGYDDLSKKATLQVKGKGFKTVPISVFTEADQAYITDWKQCDDFLSDTALKYSVQRWTVRNEEKSYLEEGVDHLYYDCSFTLTLDNRATTDFNDVKFEYVILYSQDRHGDVPTKRKTKNGSMYGSETIQLPRKSIREFKTEPVLIYHFKHPHDKSLKGEVDGILVKLTWTSPAGVRIKREFRFPEHINGIWRTKDITP